MAKVSAKGAVISVDDTNGTARDISKDVSTYEIEYTAPGKEVTGFTEGSNNFIPGQRVIGVTLDVFWNEAASTGASTVLLGIVGQTTSVTVSITPVSGGKVFSGEFMLEGPKVAGNSDGSAVKLGSCHFLVNGPTAPAWA